MTVERSKRRCFLTLTFIVKSGLNNPKKINMANVHVAGTDCGKCSRLRKGFRKLYWSFVKAIFNQTASVNDSKGESFPLDFNL